MCSVEAHLANEKAQRKAVTELIKRKQFNKVPAHLQAGYRARSRAALTNSYTQTVGHKWNARVVKALAEDLPLESKSRGKVFKEAVDARKEYQQSAQMYSTAYKRYRTVREEFSGDSSSESEKDIFDDVLLPKKKGSE